MRVLSPVLFLVLACHATVAHSAEGPASARSATVKQLPRIRGAKPRNIVFILVDDHRYDALGFMGRSFVETPALDRLAREGAHLRNAFVTTSLCSPSRASILTGHYAHRHRVIDNQYPVPAGTVFFPQYLQRAGYETALFGKWHMGGGEDARPQPGFHRWVSFPGQGHYLPGKQPLNVDGVRVPQKGYITDEITDYALDWLRTRDGRKPFFLYLSHKGVHAEFLPAERHQGRHADKPFTPPRTMALTPEDLLGRPMWVRNQRNSWHGVDFAYYGTLDVGNYFRRYAETLLAVDDSVGRVLQFLESRNQLDSTLVLYMGDNGFAFGEHGLVDKRTAYEESMRVPMLARCPELFAGGTVVERMVANIDVAPTLLESAGLRPPETFDGRSFLPLLRGQTVPWRDALLYEYFWEHTYPQTPTIHALRGERYKYVRAHGVWDLDELYDLQTDPLETRNLAVDPAHKALAEQMKQQLFDALEGTQGMNLPLLRDRGGRAVLRHPDRSRAADFPPVFLKKTAP